MTSQQLFVGKKRGRPVTGQGHQINVTLSTAMLAALDAYCERTGLKRTEALRSLLKLGLVAYNASIRT
jgi:metal-responsive CopG/Arc/MetJ family transcriptional regulator